MRRVIGIIATLAVFVSVSAAAQKGPEMTWKGKISDSMCKDKHAGGEHEGKKMTDADCTTVCVKNGSKYVFMSEGKVYQLANQNSKTIASHAGQEVTLTGELKGDTITASKISAPAKASK